MSGARRDGLFVLIVLTVGVAIALVDAFSITHDLNEAGRPIALWEPLVWELTSVVVLAALTPAVQVITRRAAPLVSPWKLVLPVHLAAAFAFSLIHVVSMGVLRWAIYALVGGDYALLEPLREFVYEFRKDLLIYIALVALYAFWMRLAPVKAGEPALQTLEVRDGARRIFVPLTDVLWVEAAGNYVELHRQEEAVLHRASLSDTERQVAAAGFVRIHRSRLVRRDAVSRVESKPSGDFMVRLHDGRELAGSRRFRRPLLEP